MSEVDHPTHYTQHPSGVECITIVRHMGFNIGNVIKYCWRAGLKGNGYVQDLLKARWYLDDEIRLRGGVVENVEPDYRELDRFQTRILELEDVLRTERNNNAKLTGLLTELNGTVDRLGKAPTANGLHDAQEKLDSQEKELTEKQKYILQLERAVTEKDAEVAELKQELMGYIGYVIDKIEYGSNLKHELGRQRYRELAGRNYGESEGDNANP